MTLIAEKIIIRSPLHLPGTDVTIQARELQHVEWLLRTIEQLDAERQQPGQREEATRER